MTKALIFGVGVALTLFVVRSAYDVNVEELSYGRSAIAALAVSVMALAWARIDRPGEGERP